MAVVLGPGGLKTVKDDYNVKEQAAEKAISSAKEKYTNKKKACIAKGGIWNEATQLCEVEAVTNKNTTPEEYEKYKLSQGFPATDTSQFSALRNAETGRLSGFEQGGKTYLGANPQDTRGALEAEANKQELLVGGQAEAVLTQRQQALQSQGLDLSAQVGQDPLEQLQSQFSAQSVSYLSALASSVPGIFPDIISGAIAGAASGAGAGGLVGGVAGTAAGGVGAVPGAAAGAATGATYGAIAFALGNAIKGVFQDFVSDVRKQKAAIIETPRRTLTETKSILNDITSAQNANPADASANLEAFNSQLQLIDDEYDRLKDLTDDNLNKFLGENGIDILQEFEVYFVPNGERDRQINDFQLALANPDPTRVNPSTVTLEEINKIIEKEIKKLQQ